MVAGTTAVMPHPIWVGDWGDQRVTGWYEAWWMGQSYGGETRYPKVWGIWVAHHVLAALSHVAPWFVAHSLSS